MILRSEHFSDCIQKIAQSITEVTEGSYSKDSSSSGSKSGFGTGTGGYNRSRRLDPQATISEARRNADVQPLNKRLNKPRDFPHATKMTKKNIGLGHMKDKRMLYEHLREDRQYDNASGSSGKYSLF